jgi:hypothetical protein
MAQKMKKKTCCNNLDEGAVESLPESLEVLACICILHLLKKFFFFNFRHTIRFSQLRFETLILCSFSTNIIIDLFMVAWENGRIKM